VDIAERFGENIFVSRRRSNLSQEELGFLASLHRTEIGQLERGARLPRIDTLIKLAGALELPAGDLLKGMAWKPSRGPNGRFIIRQEAG
jgi:XRE family transcriptional regulator, regulator of sulfur utilization